MKNKGQKKRHLALKIILGLLAFLVGIVLVVGGVFGVKGYSMYRDAVKQVPLAEKVDSIRETEHFTTYEELPEIYIDAVISVEDKRFFSHHGVDFFAIARAVWNDVRTLSFVEGGSTITQQLMKNQYFTQEKKMERKFAEVFAALELEKLCSKEEIFELYINTIYFGSGYYGLYDAAQGYYGKTPEELTEYEAVMLAGLPNAPSAYSLDVSPTLAKERMQQVLDRMVKCKAITEEKAEEILSSEE